MVGNLKGSFCLNEILDSRKSSKVQLQYCSFHWDLDIFHVLQALTSLYVVYVGSSVLSQQASCLEAIVFEFLKKGLRIPSLKWGITKWVILTCPFAHIEKPYFAPDLNLKGSHIFIKSIFLPSLKHHLEVFKKKRDVAKYMSSLLKWTE